MNTVVVIDVVCSCHRPVQQIIEILSMKKQHSLCFGGATLFKDKLTFLLIVHLNIISGLFYDIKCVESKIS